MYKIWFEMLRKRIQLIYYSITIGKTNSIVKCVALKDDYN